MSRKLIGCGVCTIILMASIVSASVSYRPDRPHEDVTRPSVSRPTGEPDGDGDGWASFVARYGKKYRNQTEANERRALRWRNVGLILAHNEAAASGKYGFTLRENNFTDWTDDEYRQLLGFKSRVMSRTTTTTAPRVRRQTNYAYPPFMPIYRNTVDVSTLPSCVNWTEHGWVGAVMNQGRCGSCWSYSATGSLQSQYYNYSGKMVQMSQQNLVDCSTPQGNEGCNGGNMENAFWYVQTNGIESLADYRDVSAVSGVSSQPCAFNASLSVTSITSWRSVTSGSESALQQAVALVGPVSTGIDASSTSFQYYSGGVYSSTTCGSSSTDLDHAVLVVGYGTYNSQPYWLLQNSWGTSWGINGYMMLARNSNNMCGIATDATFPVISQSFNTAPGVSKNASCVPYSSSSDIGDSGSSGNSANTGTAASAADRFHALWTSCPFTLLIGLLIRLRSYD